MYLSEQEDYEVCDLVTAVLCEHEHEMYMYMNNQSKTNNVQLYSFNLLIGWRQGTCTSPNEVVNICKGYSSVITMYFSKAQATYDIKSWWNVRYSMNVFVSGSECCLLYSLLEDKVCVNVCVNRRNMFSDVAKHIYHWEWMCSCLLLHVVKHICSLRTNNCKCLRLQHCPSVLKVYTYHPTTQWLDDALFISQRTMGIQSRDDRVCQWLCTSYDNMSSCYMMRHHDIVGMHWEAWPGNNHGNGNDLPSWRVYIWTLHTSLCIHICMCDTIALWQEAWS